MARRVVITGIGAVTPAGAGREKLWLQVSEGRSAATRINHFDVSVLPTRFAAQVSLKDADLDSMIDNQKSLKTMCRATKFVVVAAEEAMQDAGIDLDRLDPSRVGTAIGSGGLGFCDLEHTLQTVEIIADSASRNGQKISPEQVWRNTLACVNPLTSLKALPNMAAAHIAINYNARGPSLTLATACVSSTQAIGEAYRHIKFGLSDVMIAGGTDSMVNPNGLIAFSGLGVLSRNNREFRRAARPFDRRRDGFMLGEGSAILVLEDYDFCRQRGGSTYGEVLGYATSCDAFRLTDEPPQAWGSIATMRLALADAKLNPEEVDYINAHGTGTQMNDKTETHAIKSVFKNLPALPVSSTKSMIGHLVAAAGAAESAVSVLALDRQLIPPTINYEEPDPECELDCVPNQAREAHLAVALSNSFGFGGQNACLIFGRLQ